MVALVSLLGVMLVAASSASDAPIFSRAYLRSDSLCFNSPIELDWASLARREFKSFPLDHPPKDQLLSHLSEMGYSTFTFSAALPHHLETLHFYVLTETGPQPIVPQRLVGSIRYSYRPPARPKLEGFYGEICLSPPPTVQDAGFVVATSQPVSWHQLKADLVHSGSMTLVQLGSERSPLPPPGLDGGAVEVKSAYLLSQVDEPPRYLFVRRAAQCPEVCCEFTYDVYRFEPDLPIVASNTYGCDI